MIEKQRVRNHLLQRRKSMSSEERKKKSKTIQHRLFHHPVFQNAKTILCYVSYGHEVSTQELIKKTLNTSKQVLVPRSNVSSCTIEPGLIRSWDELTPGTYGILEPKNKSSRMLPSIDLIILPGVGFDESGRRLGHGKGYYDRFIQNHPESWLIGLAYEWQIIDTIPTTSYDQRVHEIITEDRIIQCDL